MACCMAKVSGMLCAQAWDQSVYNQEIFFLAHGPYTAPNVTVRVMDIYKFMNSKVSAIFAVLVQVATSMGGEPCSSAWAFVVLSAACSELWRCRNKGCDAVKHAFGMAWQGAKGQAGAPLRHPCAHRCTTKDQSSQAVKVPVCSRPPAP